MKGEIIGVITDPGSSLSPRAARERGVLLLDPQAPLEPQYRRYLEHYDRLLSLHASPLLCPMHGMAAEAAARIEGRRVRVVNTALGSAGLGAAALRAAELLTAGADEDAVLEELHRLASEGRFFLATHDLSKLVENQMLPPLGDRFGQALGLWALITLENGRFRTPPLPVPSGQVLGAIARLLARTYGDRRVRVRSVFGDLPEAMREQVKTVLSERLHLTAGSLAPMDPVARGRVGDHALAVFAYPV
ncbi:DegV family protein [Oceanithermus sp.]|uniref:DegV family protein n=1 Tax=Oceanithermus sp. TaxID=2268145 RepID=UPI0025D8AE7A|nr:DegV family protein [Oceanithermus sp.]